MSETSDNSDVKQQRPRDTGVRGKGPQDMEAKAGGLMSYGTNVNALFRRAASYVDKILKGANPAELPVEQPRKVDLWVNLRTAKALGLTIPPKVLVQATSVIK